MKLLKLIIFITFALIILNCKTIPEPKGDNGLLVIPINGINTSVRNGFLAHYKISFENYAEDLPIYPYKRFMFYHLPPGKYVTKKIYSVENQTIEKVSSPRELITSFVIKPNTITIFPKRIKAIQSTSENRTKQRREIFNITNSEKQTILYQLEEYENAELWFFP